MTRLVCLLLMALPLWALSQRVEKYYDFSGRPADVINARFFSVVEKKDSLWHRREYYLREKKPYMQGYYYDSACKLGEGPFVYYHLNGAIKQTGNFIKGRRHGTWKSYASSGQLVDSSTYYFGVQTGTNMRWHTNGQLSDSLVYDEGGNGWYYQWFDNGNISATGRMEKWQKEGEWTYYHRNGMLSSKESYNTNMLTTHQRFDEAGREMKDAALGDGPASFPGGEKAWRKFFQKYASFYFPETFSIKNQEQAVVVVGAIVHEDGELSDIEVLTPLHPAFDEAAIKLMKRSPPWQPAIRHNRKVKEKIVQQINVLQGR